MAARRRLDSIGSPAIGPAMAVAACAKPSGEARRIRRGKCDCAGEVAE
ncbi:hypothetical protein C7S16_1436 [Burkholderia thailandensis]|uniref:Lipoprotein n=1 Tax=Burkholderia thailandensis TaxID=57975 RepID=A0AAW9CXL1_BURTH|nr:hypothetical protein [Burkholderia thailandensis]